MKFVYDTGLARKVFQNVRLLGTWDAGGKLSSEWSESPMREVSAPDGAIVFEADVSLAASEVGKQFCWRVVLDGPLGLDRDGIVTELEDRGPLHLQFTFQRDTVEQRYYLTHLRRLGARALRSQDGQRGLGFAVWAPNAEAVDVVFGTPANGYIADDGSGIDPARPVLSLRKGADGVWSTSAESHPELARFEEFTGAPYMYRIKKEGGGVAYRTDMYSRLQIGKGDVNPHGKHYSGRARDVDGVVSCSVVVDPGRIWADLPVEGPSRESASSEEGEFWANEFNHAMPIPHRIDELVIYELHVGSLGFGKKRPGNFDDAIALLDYLTELGVNAVELLPIAEANGTRTWGYGNSHHLAIQSNAGGPEKFREFVRACHQRGIAVIVDVVYNHYVPDGERAQWHYDSDREEHNIYYWYEGKPSDYPAPDGGYLDNVSSGYAPRYHEDMVRKLFTSSAVALVVDFHVDGFRVDQTTSIHAYNSLHADGRSIGAANVAGAKFLRELSRTLRLIRPATLLTCEDHSDWLLVTEHPDGAGLGFDATWFSNFYHHLIGDTGRGSDYANLLFTAGMGGDGPLAMDRFAGALAATGRKTVVYHESHDEAGNSEHSRRTLMAAVAAGRGAPAPTGEVRAIAEGRCRFAAGMTLLSAGTPMFLMGEEIGATKDFTFDGFIDAREDLLGERRGQGSELFRYYRDLIRLRRRHSTFATPNLDIVLTHNHDRVIAFHRYKGPEHYLVVATLSDRGWPDGYELIAPGLVPGRWREIFSSDSTWYGGSGVSNEGELMAESTEHGANGDRQTRLVVKLAARAFVVLRRIPDA
jgi:1,4-alpha-glucan branching enzyme